MKVKKFFAGMMLAASVLLAAGCSSLFDTGESGSEKKEDGFVINLGLNKPGARLIRAFDYDLASVSKWVVTFTDSENNSINIETGKPAGTNGSYAAYNSTKSAITAYFIPEGTYTVALEGTVKEDSDGYKIYGSASNVEISSAGTGSVSVLVGPKTTEKATGSLSLSLADDGTVYSNLYSAGSAALSHTITATLTKVFSTTETAYSAESTASESNASAAESDDASLTFTYSLASDTALSFTLSGANIPSGWYRLSLSVSDTYRVYLPDSPDQFIEIADDTETEAETAIAAESGKAYYTTNDSSSYNGLAQSSRANLTSLLAKLAKDGGMPAEGNIYIYSQSAPEIDIATFSSLKTAVASNKKKVIIYNEAKDKETALAVGDGSGSSSVALSGDAVVAATENNAAIELDSIVMMTDITLTLKNSATLSATTVSNNNYTIKVYAVDSTGEVDNLTAYNDTPFLTTTRGDNISSYISLYEYGSSDTTENYAVIYTSPSYYIKKAGTGEITAASFASTVSIIAAYSSDLETKYTTGAAIPYTDDTLTFTLNKFTDDATTVAWYLNKDTALTAASEGTTTKDSDGNETTTSPYTYTTSFNPYNDENIEIDGTNTVSCYVTISGYTHLVEMKFTFSAARSAAVWYDTITTYALKQATGYNSATASELVSSFSTSSAYCFDSGCSLWTAVLGDSGLTLTKYPMVVSSGLYSTSGTSYTSTDITATPIDITYDTATGSLYVLTENANSGYTLYKILSFGEDSTYTCANATLSTATSSGSSFTPSQIAVHGDTLYIGADSATIYKATLTSADSTVTVGTPTTWSVIYDTLESEDLASCTITDMQIGDGLGNETDNLFVLLRQYPSYITVSGSKESEATNASNLAYSRGDLVRVAIADSDPSCYEYGWAETTTTIQDSSGYYGTLYAPLASDDDSKFYGPTHFAAVVPKKLVILDDGVGYKEKGSLYNKDSLVEFDISEGALTRGASVSATKPTTSGFTVN